MDFLETLLIENGVAEELIPSFLHPKKTHTHSPFLMVNMKEAVDLLHSTIKKNREDKKIKILVKVDPDVDGFTSGSSII